MPLVATFGRNTPETVVFNHPYRPKHRIKWLLLNRLAFGPQSALVKA
jgi:hypothetical protein